MAVAAGGTDAATEVFPGATWAESTPRAQGLNATRLRSAVDYLRDHSGRDGVRELVVVRHGYVVWHGDNWEHVHGIWSATKSFTSTVLGLLIDEGKATLDTRACQYVPELAAVYPDVTLRHFATMTSGYRAVGDEPMGHYTHGPSATPLVPSADPLFTPPGSRYAYWDSAMNQFGHVLTRIAGEPIAEYFWRKLGGPIGMDRRQWTWGVLDTVDGLAVNGGSGNADCHVKTSARELARLGLLFLNEGRWNGRQLLSKRWVQAATSVQVPATMPLGHAESGIDGRGVYGLNWWRNGLKPDGSRLWPGAPEDAFAASGFNNNDLFVLPSWRMVIVRLGLDEAPDGPITDEVYGEFLARVGQAITDRSAD